MRRGSVTDKTLLAILHCQPLLRPRRKFSRALGTRMFFTRLGRGFPVAEHTVAMSKPLVLFVLTYCTISPRICVVRRITTQTGEQDSSGNRTVPFTLNCPDVRGDGSPGFQKVSSKDQDHKSQTIATVASENNTYHCMLFIYVFFYILFLFCIYF